MMSWARADVVILTAIGLEYAAVKQVEANSDGPGGTPYSCTGIFVDVAK
jgi:hypothetical protein